MSIKKVLQENSDIVLFSPQIETLVPYASNVENSRLNMVAKQETQVSIGPYTDTPIFIDKFYHKYSEIESPFSTIAEDDGIVLLKAKEVLVIYYLNKKKIEFIPVPHYRKLINNSISLKYCLNDKSSNFKVSFSKGDLICDYTNMIPDMNIPRLGYRTDILFANFFGFNSDDALIISESYAKRTQIEYSEKIFIPITKLMKIIKKKNGDYLPKVGDTTEENILSYNMIDIGDFFLTEIVNLDDETESKYYTKHFKTIENGTIKNIKVHLNSKKSFNELREEYLYTKEFVDELEYYHSIQRKVKEEIQDTFDKIKMPKEQSEELTKSIYTQYFEYTGIDKSVLNNFRDQYGFEPEDIDFIIEIDVGLSKRTTRGDKFTNLYAGKGTTSLIIPDAVMPKNPKTGKPFDMIFNPLGIFGRNNWGSIFELGVGKIVLDIEDHIEDKEETLKRLLFIKDNYISQFDEAYAQEIDIFINNCNNDNEIYEIFKNDVKKNNFYLYSPNFPKLKYKDFINSFIEPYQKEFNINITEKETIEYSSELISYLKICTGYDNVVFPKSELESFYSSEVEAFYGTNYILKLYHTSNSKYNATAFVNSYSKTTGQPTRGRKRAGGQHLSWQTAAALLSHKDNNAVLKEFFTFKSDSLMKIKETFLMKYIKDGEYFMKPKYESRTKKTINSALRMIGMEFQEDEEG